MTTAILTDDAVEMIIHCRECGRLWGIAFEIQGEPDAVTVHRAVRALVEEFVAREFEYHCRRVLMSEIWTMELPQLTHIVYLTERHALFCAEKGYDHVEEGWYDLDEIDLPAWLTKGRKTRWCVKAVKCGCW